MFKAGYVDKCPHCRNSVRFESSRTDRSGAFQHITLENGICEEDEEPFVTYSKVNISRCPECNKLVISLDDNLVYPLISPKDPCPLEVPPFIREDYDEACLVSIYSKKASAALARRCLQNIFSDQGINKKTLSLQIDEAINMLPVYLADDIDAIRHIGNFAAHPTMYEHSSEIVEVENEELEWILHVLELLFDFFYVQPAKSKKRREQFNGKLEKIGKPLLKKKNQ